MATLEVHDGVGGVRRVTIARDQTVLFGSSPKCDIVLGGPGIFPFHGRLRWKSTRFKADASPDAGFLEINGQKMAASSFRQGDEITVGHCRIFMIHADEDLAPLAEDDKTRVQAAPAMPVAAPAAAAPRKRKRSANPPGKADLMAGLEVAPPSVEIEVDGPELLRGTSGKGEGWRSKPRAPGSKKGLVQRLKSLVSNQAAPGEERVLSSPLVFGLAVTLAVLIGLGVMLQGIIARTISTRLYQRAVESLDDGDYRNALRRFDEYLARRSGDEKTRGKARVLRALANVRQFTSATGASWSNALAAEVEMVQDVSREPAYRDSSTDLAELVVRTGESLADRARTMADRKSLSEAESAVALHAQVTGAASEALLARSRLPAKLAEARAAVRKGLIRTQTLAAMDTALKEGSASKVYAARDDLVRQYADLSEDRELVARMTRANDLIRSAVKFDPSRRPAETEPHPGQLGPATSLVLQAAAAGSEPRAESGGALVFALADGFAYGLDGASGTPRWQVPVGLTSPFPPQPIPGGTTALCFDARHNELIRLDARSGTLVWRQTLGEPIADPPAVLGNQIIQATPSGQVLLIDLPTGELRGSCRLGMPLLRTPVSDESGQYLYVLAAKDCLFVLKRDPLGCEAVEYLGHAAGSIACPPARLGRFLIVPENHTLAEGRWRICALEQDGARVKPVQQLPTAGWTWGTPASAGSVVWSTGDRGGVAAYGAGGYEQKVPFRLITRLTPDTESSGPAFGLARNERELWLSGGRPGRYDLTVESGSILKTWSLSGAGPALAPIQLAGPLVVFTQQSPERPGVSLWGLEQQTGAVRWQTLLGTAWPLAPVGTPDGEKLTTLGFGGEPLSITGAQLGAGGFLKSSLPGPGEFRVPAGRVHRLEGDGMTVLVPSAEARHLLVRSGEGKFRRVELPVRLAADPLLWGSDVLIPGDDGRAYLIDPTTGESRAEPFVPVFDRARPTHWRSPVKLDDNAVALADDAGKVRRLSLVKDPRPRLTATAEASLGSGLIGDPTSTGAAIIVATLDGRIRALSARDLSPAGAWEMEAPLAMTPVAVGGRAFAADHARGVHAFANDGQRLWSATLRGGAATGPPVVRDDSAWFLARDGSVERLSLADGKSLDRIELDLLPAGSLSAVGDRLVVPVASGTLRLLNIEDQTKATIGGKP